MTAQLTALRPKRGEAPPEAVVERQWRGHIHRGHGMDYFLVQGEE